MPGAKALINLMGFANTYPQIGAISKILSLTSAVSSNFLGCRFFDERSEEKKHCAAGESGGRCKLFPPSRVGAKSRKVFGYFAF